MSAKAVFPHFFVVGAPRCGTTSLCRYLARNPHMKGRDFETTRKACEKFRHTPTSVINFVEGTRFSVEKRDRHNAPYRHLLRPRAGGFAVAMSSMGEMFGAI